MVALRRVLWETAVPPQVSNVHSFAVAPGCSRVQDVAWQVPSREGLAPRQRPDRGERRRPAARVSPSLIRRSHADLHGFAVLLRGGAPQLPRVRGRRGLRQPSRRDGGGREGGRVNEGSLDHVESSSALPPSRPARPAMAGRASKSWCPNLRESAKSADEFHQAEAAVPTSASRLAALERRLLKRARG
jgi:hypothetical protein